MLVDRGPIDPGATPCKFAQKVWNAQQAGARAVVVVNYEDRMTTMEAPDDDDEVNYRYLKNITSELLPSSYYIFRPALVLGASSQRRTRWQKPPLSPYKTHP